MNESEEERITRLEKLKVNFRRYIVIMNETKEERITRL